MFKPPRVVNTLYPERGLHGVDGSSAGLEPRRPRFGSALKPVVESLGKLFHFSVFIWVDQLYLVSSVIP